MSIDGFNLGIGTSDGWLKIMNTRTMELEQDLEQFYATRIKAVCFSADGRLLCGGTEKGGLAVVLNQHSEGFFSKASKVWVLFVFFLYFYLFFTGGR